MKSQTIIFFCISLTLLFTGSSCNEDLNQQSSYCLSQYIVHINKIKKAYCTNFRTNLRDDFEEKANELINKVREMKEKNDNSSTDFSQMDEG